MSPPEEIIRLQKEAKNCFLYFCTFVLFLHGMGIGAGLGYAGFVYPHHRQNSSLIPLTEEEGTWFVSSTPLSMMLGVLISIPASEKIGRKPILLLGNILSICGYILMYFCKSFLLLMLGRIIQSCGMGLGVMTTAVYLSEVTVVRLRGPLIGTCQTACCFGLLASSILCIFLPIFLLSPVLCANSLLVVVLILLLPESPQWLMRNEKNEEARKNLLKLRGAKYPGISAEIEEIRNCATGEGKKKSSSNPFGSKAFVSPLLMLSVIFVVLATCGNDTIIFYGPTIFAKIDIGIPSTVLATLPWIGFSAGYAVSNPLMAKMKRRPQYILGAVVMSASMITLGVSIKFMSDSGDCLACQICLIASLLTGTIAYGCGVGAIPYTMIGEIFTPEHKTLGSCICQCVRTVCIFLLVKLFPNLVHLIGLHGVFIFHGVVLAGAVVFAWIFMPETKGKTLTELCRIYEPTKNLVGVTTRPVQHVMNEPVKQC